MRRIKSLKSASASASTSTRSNRNSMKSDVIHMERNRREKMTEFYTILQSLVPNLFPKATRTRIIDETISYIKGLEAAIAALDARKAASAIGETTATAATTRDRRSGPEASSTSAVTITAESTADTAFFGVCVAPPRTRGAAARVLRVFEDHGADVLSATVQQSGGGGDRHTLSVAVTSVVCDREAVERIRGDLMSIV
ncbi:transcription factor bHLH95-like [Ananas comosus]|uniref:Transcription factor bHLH95-like n=1 Tax=Ananas comosus TaxID=4615 RepID=A0A6P5G0T6_ANACO|nr:transcription factor bHLH95-like [Ananas comosus]